MRCKLTETLDLRLAWPPLQSQTCGGGELNTATYRPTQLPARSGLPTPPLPHVLAPAQTVSLPDPPPRLTPPLWYLMDIWEGDAQKGGVVLVRFCVRRRPWLLSSKLPKALRAESQTWRNTEKSEEKMCKMGRICTCKIKVVRSIL